MYRRPVRVYTLLTEQQANLIDEIALINRRSRSGMIHVMIWDWLTRAEIHDELVAERMRQYREEEDHIGGWQSYRHLTKRTRQPREEEEGMQYSSPLRDAAPIVRG